MADGKRGISLATIFWIAACGNLLLVAIPALDAWNNPHGQFDGIVALGLGMIFVFLAVVSIVVAVIRRRAAYWVGLVLVAWPAVWWCGMKVQDAIVMIAAPSAEEMAKGHWIFKTQAEGALADAIIAGDVAKTTALAPTARLDAQGESGMTFMRLALENGHANPDIVGALLRSGIDPDQNQGLLFGTLESNGISTGSDGGVVLIGGRNERLLRAVIDTGVDLNHVWSMFPRYFSLLPWPEGLAIALEHGANIEAEDTGGDTAIMMAVRYEYWPAIDVLLAHGARLNHKNHDGHSLRDLVTERMGYASRDGQQPAQLVALNARLRQ